MRKMRLILSLAFMAALLFSCTKDPNTEQPKKGSPLELIVQFGPMTRLGELPPGQIGTDNKGLKNVGLYIYYTDDYNAGIVTQPYVRNLECTVIGNRLVPVTGEPIYAYDRMTLVAFYPYNNSVINFATKADEAAYPITRSEYADQTYIPYRAQTSIDPTVAYKVNLNFVPKCASKIEIVIVGNASAPATLSNPKVLPRVDPMDAPVGFDRRERMVDITNLFTNSGGGMSVTQYVAYVWTNEEGDVTHDNNSHFDNVINMGDPVFESDELTLLATQTVNFAEDRVYRYGYNTTTGEIFIPTSSQLVYDLASFRASPYGYQVCDIDLSSMPNWIPINISGNSYDGGGHKISGLSITSLPGDGNAGLFGKVQGNASLRNINLVAPQINISAGTSAANVGALCGLNNQTLNLTADDIAAMRQALVNSLPPGVSSVVIDALLQDQIKALQGGTSSIVGCNVSNAVMTLSGKALKAGLMCGINGDLSAKSQIVDSYATGTINANVGVGIVNDTCLVAGLVGVNNATITRSYSTAAVVAEKYTVGPPPVKYNGGAGFCFQGPRFTSNSGSVNSCYASQANTQPVVTLFSTGRPSWPIYTGKWPIYTTVPLWQSMGSLAASTYPKLVWER